MKPLCFVLMPFGRKPEGTGRIIDFDAVYNQIIAPAIEAAGMDPVRADQEEIGGTIHKPMFERLMLCDYAVADVTGANPNVAAVVVIGVVLGAAFAARLADDVRWEACDDARELKRHIMGAALMGFGGVLAFGCTIGQGISAASMLAVSVPFTMGAIVLGARLGLAWLLEGSIASAFRR